VIKKQTILCADVQIKKKKNLEKASVLSIFLFSGKGRPHIQLSIPLRSISISLRLVKTTIPKISGVNCSNI
jgi:hypothetical protein